jgi:hypothetical protein
MNEEIRRSFESLKVGDGIDSYRAIEDVLKIGTEMDELSIPSPTFKLSKLLLISSYILLLLSLFIFSLKNNN